MTTSGFSGAFEDAARLRAVLDSAVDGIITIDERGTIEAANPAAELLFGYSASELVGRNVRMLMPSPWRDEHDAYLRNYLRTGRKSIIGTGREVRGLRKDGSVFPLYLAVSETDFGDRRVFTGSLHDLTELKDAEQQAGQLGQILDDSLNEIYVFDAETLLFLHVNQGALHNVGYSSEEMSRMTPLDVMTQFSREQFHELLQTIRKNGKSSVQRESIHRRRDGSLYNVLVRLHTAPWNGRDAFVAISLDVTEQLQRAVELRIRNQALEAAMEGVLIADAALPNRPIIYVNPAFEALSGYSSEEAVGRPCDLLFHAEPETPEVKQVRQAVSDGTELRLTLQCARKHGQRFWNSVSIAPVRSVTGTVTHIVAVMEDVSERRRAEEQLLQSERLAAIGQMVTGLAHESRNALQRAQACLDMLALDLEDQPEQLELMEKMRRALQDLYRHYEEVRNYAAPIVLERRSVNLRTLWRSTWRDLESVRFGRHLELIEDDTNLNLDCMIDGHRMEQVFRNILENAIAVCPDEGHVTIGCSKRHYDGRECLEVRFEDDGPGFRPEALENVFEPFFTTRQKGTGLGMAIARRIVEAHGGILEADNGPREGAVISVVLPETPD